jgi:monooxygenase
VRASWQSRVAAFLVRRRVRPALGDMADVRRVRRVFAAALPVPRGARFTAAVVGGVPGEWVVADGGPPAAVTLLYLHGGGFVGCSPRTHRPITAALARQGLRVFAPDYRLAPEHPFPAAPEDVLAVYRALRRERPQERLVVAGDSGGGNLALGLLLALKDGGERLPEAAALFSPSTDLTGGSPSLRWNAERDAMFPAGQLRHLAAAYLAGADPAQALASPLRGDLSGLPPLLIHVGRDEALRDDALRLAGKARAAGVTVELEVFPAVPHDWQLLHRLPEARRSIRAAARFLKEAAPREEPETLDVLVVGAGLSGIGAAVHLQRECPGRTYALLEARQSLGGTWDLFRYPGVRSDSDMYTLGYEFKPWSARKAIADGPEVRRYIAETAEEHGVAAFIRYGHRVVAADWSAAGSRWTVTVERGRSRERVAIRARFLLFCSGYYSYAEGHRPSFPEEARYRGTLVHPQFWPESLDCTGKRVVVIGSGATAVTLVPALAETAAHVTMLQRSPSYVFAMPSRDAVADRLRRWLPERWAYRLVRLKNVALSMYLFRAARRRPEATKARLMALARRQLPAGFDVERHFSPRYLPWDQRVCLAPDGDLFRVLREGRASVVTDTIEAFTERGIRLRSGDELPADVVVAATGLQLNVLGDVALSLDGEAYDPSKAIVYKGAMYSGLPNLASVFGYTNASWTLKADLIARYVCRLLNHMERHGFEVCVPVADGAVTPEPLLDFTSGYVQRALPRLPKQGDRAPWRLYQNYVRDLLVLRWGRVDDGVVRFEAGGAREAAPVEPARGAA